MKIVGVLPFEARKRLMRAASTPVKNEHDRARINAIERCLELLRIQYPDHFKQEEPIHVSTRRSE